MCSFMDSVCVSSCRCCVFVSVVHPVAILSVVFCAICSLFVSDASGDHMVEHQTDTACAWLVSQRGSDLPFCAQAGHADPLVGWRCSS